ncbi:MULTISPECIES: hypothetical protein [Clostridium]|uniref:hypothetical protein n=1 Tax=Clostridium TaxID=1485 RepID=UPI000CBD35FD|nr:MULTISPECIES: hypothetical protein [Clostridium]PJI10125.1 hypothetical protein CUB90_20615 [Clostridium sp. CT7]
MKEIKVEVYNPTQENETEYYKRGAICFVSAIAKKLTCSEIDELIEILKKDIG